MKKCTECSIELTTKTAYKRHDSKVGTTSKCRACFNKYCNNRQVARKLEAIESKGNRCFDCKQSFHYSVYDFHHLDPAQKDIAWNKMRLVSKQRLEKELAKCILLCSNCHRMRHYISPGSEI